MRILFKNLLALSVVLMTLQHNGPARADDQVQPAGVTGSGVTNITGSGVKNITGSGIKSMMGSGLNSPAANEGAKVRQEDGNRAKSRPRRHREAVVVVPLILPVTPPTLNPDQGNNAIPPGLAPGYWYFCASANTYYPYIDQCPEDWQAVTPPPPPPPPAP